MSEPAAELRILSGPFPGLPRSTRNPDKAFDKVLHLANFCSLMFHYPRSTGHKH